MGKQSNRGDMRQFFKSSGPQGHFFEKKQFLDMFKKSVCKFQVCIFFHWGKNASDKPTYLGSHLK